MQAVFQMTNSNALEWTYSLRKLRFAAQCLASAGVLALMTYCGLNLQVNLTTISFLYLLVIVATASRFGIWQASLTSLVAAACLDYFFTVPLFQFVITDPQNWVALGAFQVTALVIGRLTAKKQKVASEAAIHRKGMEQLYELSRNSLLLDMREAPGPQLVVLIQRIFGPQRVALFDGNLGRQDRAGEWDGNDENVARDAYLLGAAADDPPTETWTRILQAGPRSVGALVVRGNLSPLVVDALASLAAMAIDRYQSFEKEERASNASNEEQLRGAVMDALAHDFKTPLTAIQTSSSGLLELGGLTDSQRELVTLIDSEAVRLNELCSRLLMAAKLKVEYIGLKTEDVNVQELLAEVLNENSAERRRIQVSVEDPSLTIRVDRGLLAMILAQYIDNARKYSTPDTPIEIAARQSKSEVLFSVHNFGPTIRIEDRERIFDRFYRASNLRNSIPGTGIGLSVVRKTAEAQHGHVWVISDDKEGTTFFLSLPKGVGRLD